MVLLQLPDADIVFYPSLLNDQESDRLLTELTETINWRQDWITIYGRSIPQPRLTAWYGNPGKFYTYSGITMSPSPWIRTLLDLKAKTEAVSGVVFNSVLLNLYRDGNDSMGWHSDDEPELGNNPVIGSLSLGGTRRFMLRHRVEKGLKHKLELTSAGLTQNFLLDASSSRVRSITHLTGRVAA